MRSETNLRPIEELKILVEKARQITENRKNNRFSFKNINSLELFVQTAEIIKDNLIKTTEEFNLESTKNKEIYSSATFDRNKLANNIAEFALKITEKTDNDFIVKVNELLIIFNQYTNKLSLLINNNSKLKEQKSYNLLNIKYLSNCEINKIAKELLKNKDLEWNINNTLFNVFPRGLMEIQEEIARYELAKALINSWSNEYDIYFPNEKNDILSNRGKRQFIIDKAKYVIEKQAMIMEISKKTIYQEIVNKKQKELVYLSRFVINRTESINKKAEIIKNKYDELYDWEINKITIYTKSALLALNLIENIMDEKIQDYDLSLFEKPLFKKEKFSFFRKLKKVDSYPVVRSNKLSDYSVSTGEILKTIDELNKKPFLTWND